ncbi:9381_t:CDS:2, partial [Gigaspora margarita]
IQQQYNTLYQQKLNLQHQNSNLQHQNSNLQHQNSTLSYQNSNLNQQIRQLLTENPIDKLEKQVIRKKFELKKAKSKAKANELKAKKEKKEVSELRKQKNSFRNEALRYKAKYDNLKKDVEAMKELNKIKFEKLSQSRDECKKKWQEALDDKKLIQEIVNSLQEVFDSNFYNQIVSGVEDAMKA